MTMKTVTENATAQILLDANINAVFVVAGVTVSDPTLSGIGSTVTTTTAIVQGNVVGNHSGINLGSGGTDLHDQKVAIYSGGTVTGTGIGWGGVAVTGYHSSVQNAGEIWGDNYGVYLDSETFTGHQSAIGNTGSIIGGLEGLYVLGNDKVVVTNSGFIHGDDVSFIDHAGDGIQKISNTGVMEGNIVLAGGDDVYNGSKGSLKGEVFGGEGNDKIKTGADDDQIHGGNGLDRMTGGMGEDTFYFDTSANGSLNADTITDFDPDNDILALDHTIFGLSAGKLSAASFLASKNGAAAEASDHFLYNTTNGNLYFDADGKGGNKAELMATFLHHPDITAADFIVI